MICCAGADGGWGPLRGPRGWKKAVEAAGDHLGRETWETEQRKDEGSQGGEREQEPGVPAYQGKMSDCLLACWLWVSHIGAAEGSGLLGCDAVWRQHC